MNYANEDSRARKQRELDEQTLIALGQIITEREQARADRDQHRLDETQFDDNQGARDLRRNVLDNQQTLLDRLANLNVISNALPGAAAQRDRARRLRDVAALARAEHAHRRAEEARHPVRACEHRKKDASNKSWLNAA
jgi:hypothetical protein